MDHQLTTRQVAEALKVSESSVKRWCDSGAIRTVKTVGGHRRIPREELQQFLTTSNRLALQRSYEPPVTAAQGDSAVAENVEELLHCFLESLESGNEQKCRDVFSRAVSIESSLAVLADKMIAPAFQSLGERWDCGKLEIFQERRACEITSRLIHEHLLQIPDARDSAPLAIGGSPSADYYSQPSQLVELVLRQNQWRTVNLGTNLPLQTIANAVNTYHPQMLWLSVSHLENPDSFILDFEEMRKELPAEIFIVIGGRALTDNLRPRLKYTAHCDNMQQLAAFASALRGKNRVPNASNN